jgi:FkbM family methyltransferase
MDRPRGGDEAPAGDRRESFRYAPAVPDRQERRRERRVKRPGRLNRPHFVFNPTGLVGRGKKSGQTTLPWGLPLRYAPNGPMGNALDRTRIYDLAITEAIFRLLGPGDTAVDVGTNVGYMTSIMARRVGSEGRVVCFEPQPAVFSLLEQNIASWRERPGPLGQIEPHRLALSSAAGRAALNIPEDRDGNHERASLRSFKKQAASVEVDVRRLDEVVAAPTRIDLLKVDAERHELDVLEGAEGVLQSTSTVIVEEHEVPPTPVTRLLLEHGFVLYALHESFAGLRIRPLDPDAPHVGWGPPNVLATREPAAAKAALRRPGWRSLRHRVA